MKGSLEDIVGSLGIFINIFYFRIYGAWSNEEIIEFC